MAGRRAVADLTMAVAAEKKFEFFGSGRRKLLRTAVMSARIDVLIAKNGKRTSENVRYMQKSPKISETSGTSKTLNLFSAATAAAANLLGD